MSTIEFKDLNKSIGTELFTDTESFLEDLGDDAADVVGGNGNRSSVVGKFPNVPLYQTTHYIPSGPDRVSATIILHNPHFPRHPRPIHPVRHPRPIHPAFAASDM